MIHPPVGEDSRQLQRAWFAAAALGRRDNSEQQVHRARSTVTLTIASCSGEIDATRPA